MKPKIRNLFIAASLLSAGCAPAATVDLLAVNNARLARQSSIPDAPACGPICHAHLDAAKAAGGSASCVDQQDDPRIASIKSRIATDSPPTVAQLADTGKPNSAERARLIEWGTLLSYCRDKGFGPQPGYPWEQFQVAIASLAAGEVTYGTHNRRIVELLAISEAHADAEQQRIAAQRAIEQAQADAAAGAALSAGLDMFLAGQQIRTLRGR